MKMECESDLAEAMPILNEALAALDTIKDADIQYIKKLGNPPALIKLVMEARFVSSPRTSCMVLSAGLLAPEGWQGASHLFWKEERAQRMPPLPGRHGDSLCHACSFCSILMRSCLWKLLNCSEDCTWDQRLQQAADARLSSCRPCVSFWTQNQSKERMRRDRPSTTTGRRLSDC